MSQKKQTGIFLPYFQGQRLSDFPQALNNLLSEDNIHYYDGVYQAADSTYYVRQTTKEMLLKVHSEEMIRQVQRSGYFETASYSAGVTVQAAEEILAGSIDNAFVFTGVGDHHAGRNFFGGMCYFNGAALAIAILKERGMKRFAIVDTDSHHADGTRDIFARDKNVLHACFCSQDYSDSYYNIDVEIPFIIKDEDYLQKMRQVFMPAAKSFRPEIIFWEFGYDATQGEYGDKGLSKDCHVELARIIKSTADTVCSSRLITILCGGSRRDLATYIIPKIITVLAELG